MGIVEKLTIVIPVSLGERFLETGTVPMRMKKLEPLVALHHILQHCLPAYFQKCRYYGLHANAFYKSIVAKLPDRIKNNKHTIRPIYQILKALLGVDKISCDQCGHEHLDEQIVSADTQWIYTFIEIHTRGSPQNSTYDPFHKIRTQERKLLFMRIEDENHRNEKVTM